MWEERNENNSCTLWAAVVPLDQGSAEVVSSSFIFNDLHDGALDSTGKVTVYCPPLLMGSRDWPCFCIPILFRNIQLNLLSHNLNPDIAHLPSDQIKTSQLANLTTPAKMIQVDHSLHGPIIILYDESQTITEFSTSCSKHPGLVPKPLYRLV